MTGQATGWYGRLDVVGKVIAPLAGIVVLAGVAVGLYAALKGPRDSVRVLLAIDISGSQNNELRAGEARTRIEAAQEWAPHALDSLKERDQLGIATFSTSGRSGCRSAPTDRPRSLGRLRRCLEPRMVVPIRSLTADHKRAIAAGLKALRANTGGTPLHQSIAWGVEQLQVNWADGKQALVILSDGEEHASDNPSEQYLATEDAEARLQTTDEADMDVRVFGTAVSPAADCEDRRPRFYDECYPAVTETDLQNALTGILGELGLPEPSTQPGAG